MEYGYIPIFKESLSYKGFCGTYCREPYKPKSKEYKDALISKLNSWEAKFDKIINS